jgi:diguanylate cyclase
MTTNAGNFLNEFHWLMDVVHNIDIGLVVLDLNYNIKLWNGFMQNHSAKDSSDVLDQNIFEIFPELPATWFRRKLQSVTVLHNASFTTWEQRPYLFRFKNYRPVTGMARHMYQNCTILPLTNSRGQIDHICLIVYDVTETATNRLQLQKANEQLHHISRTDGLTGLLNRKTWEQLLFHEFKRYHRYQRPSSLIMFDIDHFKKINDSYGHPAGDDVIRRTAAITKECIRDSDVAGRYGGEEFAIILIDTDIKGAQIVAERLRAAIESLTVTYEKQDIQYTISLGVTALTPQIKDPTHWIEIADKGLYSAKHNGRNQVAINTL